MKITNRYELQVLLEHRRIKDKEIVLYVSKKDFIMYEICCKAKNMKLIIGE